MSALTSTSTLAEVSAAYDNGASYLEDGSVSKAKAFITACRFLIRRYTTGASVAGSSIQRDLKLIQSEMQAAIQFVADNGGFTIAGADSCATSIADLRESRI
jgi:hypothetical protein